MKIVIGKCKNIRVFQLVIAWVFVFILLYYRESLKEIHINLSNHFKEGPSKAVEDRLKRFTDVNQVNITKKRETHKIAGLCKEEFNDTFEDNLKVVKNYPTAMAEFYWSFLGADGPGPTDIPEYPVIVTAYSQAFYPVSQGLFRSIHILNDTAPYKGKIKCLVYDLGLKKKTLDIVKSKSRCEVRAFPFGELPAHVRKLKTYAFKPIIVQMTLLEFGSIWWTDSMIRVNSTHFDLAVEYLKTFGWIFMTTKSDKDSFSIARQTDLGMFRFLGEDPCKFRSYGEIWACTTLFYYNNVSRSVVRAWVSCALNEACIAPTGAGLMCEDRYKQDGRCHRYDQSMLGIIARRLYHEQHQYPLDERVRSIYREGRGEFIEYF